MDYVIVTHDSAGACYYTGAYYDDFNDTYCACWSANRYEARGFDSLSTARTIADSIRADVEIR